MYSAQQQFYQLLNAIALCAVPRSEFGEEFGEGSLEPLTRAAERGSVFGELTRAAELTVEASRRSLGQSPLAGTSCHSAQ